MITLIPEWILVALFLLFLPRIACPAEPLYSAGLGFEYYSGDYGTHVTSESLYMPLSLSYYPTRRIDVSLEIPYVYQSSGAVGAGLFRGPQGQPMLLSNPIGTQAGMQGGPGSGMGQGMVNSQHLATASGSESGLGDITLKGGYILVPEGRVVPQIRPNFFVKLPTADEDKALGTGEVDEGFAVAVSKFVDAWYSFAELGYTVQGKSELLPLKDYLFYRAALGYQVTEKFLPLLILKGFTAPAEGTTDLLEARLMLKYRSSDHIGIEGYLAKGLTTASPDYGAGLSVFYDY